MSHSTFFEIFLRHKGTTATVSVTPDSTVGFLKRKSEELFGLQGRITIVGIKGAKEDQATLQQASTLEGIYFNFNFELCFFDFSNEKQKYS
jgi:hypothetical protein